MPLCHLARFDSAQTTTQEGLRWLLLQTELKHVNPPIAYASVFGASQEQE